MNSDASSTTATLNPPGESATAGADPFARAKRHLDAAIDHLLSLQHDDGHWCAELEGDSILQSEYILMMWILGLEKDARLPKIANYLRSQQRSDGSWGQYPGGQLGGGKFDLSATVKGYFALKLMGDSPDAPHMARARQLVRSGGGAEMINTFSKFYLAALGQVRYNAVPIIPPQIIFLPKWCYFHMSKVAAWTRTMIAPLSIVTMRKPLRTLPKQLGIDELFTDESRRHRLFATGLSKSPFWTNLFLWLDSYLKLLDAMRLLPLRERGVKRMEEWLLKRCEKSDGPGAIFPPVVYILIAFVKGLGYPLDHPVVKDNLRHLDNYMIHGRNGKPRGKPEDAADDTIHLQPCESPMWDTGIAAYALANAGLDMNHPAVRKCSDFLVKKECREFFGDWKDNVDINLEPSGWYFEYNNPWYIDADDTVMIMMALQRIGAPDGIAAAQRGAKVALAMQNDDGGWAAFDKTTHRQILEYVPFADHNAMQDPSCADITGRTLEGLGNLGHKLDHPAVQRALVYLKKSQEPEGCWYGRWGINYIYGTYQVLVGLKLIGVDMNEPWVRRAGEWLLKVQHSDGSFGESPDSYEDPSTKGVGPSTASQTAWGGMGLMTIFGAEHPAVAKAVDWLCSTQLANGNWREDWFTGGGFPKVFYLRYHLYKLYFPLMFIGRWLNAQGKLNKRA